MDILDNIVETAHSMDERSRATRYIRIAQTYEVAFMLHLMKEVLEITNDLSTCLQKKEQDIANVMLLVKVTKIRLQELRENEIWDLFVVEVFAFCIKYNIVVSNFDESYVNSGRSRRKSDDYTFFIIIVLNMCPLENQLANYIIDVRDIDKRFSDLHGLCDLSKKLVETKKHSCYPLVFRLAKFALLLPVATASIERAFSGMKFIKNKLQSRMNDDFLSGCMVPFMERDVFKDVSTDDIILSFQAMKPRRIVL
ncbi:uncharacterized protein LOC125839902 [Solanum verrucosum]|uniref:uncharacterized protein LOC125839902 n=1 Tax=Solanum verrucosum TaxID=315347 RepID=UPI0020D16334|nr:uncharacterized protein LOC125839902 [Solanum verrucosum]